eukprot:CAMPEP_0171917038 /NCGR_PEP_ID=MMETSP0993-20121228/15557_1 /TAXON_ID=483369 /ORGANISM="non described non described, Strain CCMP2098" /LENGTH=670 /DNA_ID=CAMNT_0012552725 /DNA_START=246 /DNA_END=2258 /DNA_ORIENTATION=+
MRFRGDIDKTELWQDRSFARNSMVVSLGMIALGITSIDSTSFMPVLFLPFALVVIYFLPSFTKLFPGSTLLRREGFFSGSIVALSIFGMLHFLYLASSDFEPSEYSHRANRSMTKRMNKQGHVPSPIILSFLLPSLATSAGMDAKVAKNVSSFNFLILIAIAFSIHSKISNSESSDCLDVGIMCEDYRVFDLIHDVFVTLATISIGVFSSVTGAEVTEAYVDRLRTGRHADSVLNHVLKNKIAGAAAAIEIFIQDHPLMKSELQPSCDQMYRSMSWCAVRQTMMDLVAGTYTSTLHSVNTQKFLEGVISPSVAFTINDHVSGQSDSLEILFDEKLAQLALENAVSNSVAHGDGISPIQLEASFLTEQVFDRHEEGMLVLTVENELHPGANLTNELLQKFRTQSTQKSSLEPYTYESQRSPLHNDMRLNSTNSGLAHVTLACNGARGSFELLLGKQRKSVIARIKLPAKKQKHVNDLVPRVQAERHSSRPERKVIFPGLRVCCIDDSKMICKSYKRLLLPLMQADLENSNVTCPTSPEDIESFVEAVLAESTQSTIGDRATSKLSRKAADIVVLDQNIDMSNLRTVYGTDVALTLKARGYNGLVVLRTGNMSPDDKKAYMATGAVDDWLGKDTNHTITAAQIFEAYSRKKTTFAWYGARGQSKEGLLKSVA